MFIIASWFGPWIANLCFVEVLLTSVTHTEDGAYKLLLQDIWVLQDNSLAQDYGVVVAVVVAEVVVMVVVVVLMVW